MPRRIFILVLCLIAVFLNIEPALSKSLVSRSFYVMGTELTFDLVCNDKDHCYRVIQKAIQEVIKLDRTFSHYRNDSELYKVIRSDYRYPVKVSEDLFYLTGVSVFISALTNGAFDITAGSLVDIWKKGQQTGFIPDSFTIKRLKSKCVGIDRLKLVSKEMSLLLNSDCIDLDYGGIGKGYALDKISEVLESEEVDSGIINFGGNIYAKGKNLENNKWKVSVKIPPSLKYKIVIDSIYLSNLAVSTSGGYERYFKINDQEYSHIINPRSGYPVSQAKSVTVISSNAAIGDALSTAFSVMDISEVKKLVKELDKIGVLIVSDKFKYENSYFKELYDN